MPLNRREFLLTTAAGLAACAKPPSVLAPKRASLTFGYASITWGNNDLLAMQEISELGYSGIQLRANIVNSFVRNPPTLTSLLADKHLSLIALSSGPLQIDSPNEARMLGEHAGRGKFLKDVGGKFLQVTDERPKDRAVSFGDVSKLASLLNELGRRCTEVGVTLVYHPHMGTMGEKPDDSDRILAGTDPANVKLLLDVAHYKQGGGDPAAAIRKHRDRLALLHLKDVEAASNAQGYRFVELGRGIVNLGAVFTALDEIGYNGWAIVELDTITEPGRTAKESAAISKAWLTAHGLPLG